MEDRRKAYLDIAGTLPERHRRNYRWEILRFSFRNLAPIRTKVYIALYFFVLAVQVANFLVDLVEPPGNIEVWLMVLTVGFGLFQFYDKFLNFRKWHEKYEIDSVDPAVAAALQRMPRSGGSIDFPDAEVIQASWLENAFSFSPSFDFGLRNRRVDCALRVSGEKQHRIRRELRKKSGFWEGVLKAKWWQSSRSGPVRKRQEFRDDAKICLTEDPQPDKGSLDIFRGSYYLSYLTNELCSRDIACVDDGQKDTVDRAAGRFPFRKPWQEQRDVPVLLPIADTQLSNHLGANVLAITADGLLCLWYQGDRAQVSRRLLAPTGSGSLDWDDLVNRDGSDQYSLLDTVEFGMARELLEESTRAGGRISGEDVVFLRVIGYFRNIGRGGLPGFSGVARLNVDSSKVFPNRTETYEPRESAPGSGRQTRFRADSRAVLSESLETLLQNNLFRRQLSLPLFANLHALMTALSDDGFAAELFPDD